MSRASWSEFTIQFMTAILCENSHHHADYSSAQWAVTTLVRYATCTFSQNLGCPQGTKAKPSMGANKHTSQHRDGVSAAAGVPGTDAAADALAAVGVNCSSSSSSSSELLACWLGCSASVRLTLETYVYRVTISNVSSLLYSSPSLTLVKRACCLFTCRAN